ncbi:MAG: SDR family NAD(P)-dependent oxidoreductase [Roseburia sp.]
MEYALITGATGGIGYALAECFAKDGKALVLVSSNMEHLKKAKEKLLANYNVPIEVCEKNLTGERAAEELFLQLKERKIKITYLVNNAGFGLLGKTEEIAMDKEEAMLILNMMTPVKLVKLFLPEMKRAGCGYILNVASVGAFQPGPYNSSYYATKAFLYHYSRGVRYEAKKSGVSISTLCPGTTGTDFFKKAGTKTPKGAMTPEQVAVYAYRKMKKKKDVIIPGFWNRMARFVPSGIKLRVIAIIKERQAKCK